MQTKTNIYISLSFFWVGGLKFSRHFLFINEPYVQQRFVRKIHRRNYRIEWAKVKMWQGKDWWSISSSRWSSSYTILLLEFINLVLFFVFIHFLKHLKIRWWTCQHFPSKTKMFKILEQKPTKKRVISIFFLKKTLEIVGQRHFIKKNFTNNFKIK